ncbi:MAG TPA: MFS transporter [Mycobacteriales bacterium]|nr:MFS transporter [Mycobacteriales bacterium]
MGVRSRAAAAGQNMFRSLAEPNYRLFFAGQAVSVIGTWMQRVAQDWLVLQITDSPVALGMTTALQFLPMLLFGIWGGVIVDRVDRRRAIGWAQAASAVLAAILAVATLTGTVTLGLVYLLAVGLGLVTVIDVPARQAFVTELVGADDYVNAQALNSSVNNTGRLVGPAIAGGLIAWVGAGPAFALNAVSFVAVLIVLARMDPSRLRKPPVLRRGPGQARQGLAYVWRHPTLRACLLVVAVVGLFGQNFRVVLPVLARDELGGNAATYGWLTAALGLGAVLGGLASATRHRPSGPGLVLATLAFAVVNGLAAVAPGLDTALLAMVGVGITNITFNTLARTLLQLGTDPVLQGRVLAVHGLVFLGSTPIGAPLLGWVCALWGARAGLWVAAGTALIAAVAVWPALGRARPPAPAADPTRPATVDPRSALDAELPE